MPALNSFAGIGGIGGLVAIVLTVVSSASCTSREPEQRGVAGLASRASNTSTVRSAPVARAEAPTADEPSPLPSDASLEDMLRFAALNNPGLEAAFHTWRAALERVPQVTSLPDPRFTYRYFIEEVETRVGPQRQGLGLSQMFPWFGKLELRGDAATAAANAARQRYEDAKLALFQEVTDAHCELYYIERAIDVLAENFELVKHFEEIAQARYRTGGAGQDKVIRAQLELGRIEDALNSIRDKRASAVARLNAALNRPPEAEVGAPQPPREQHLAAGEAELYAWLDEHNAQLAGLRHEIEQRRWEVDLARKEYYPDITVGLDYTDVGSSPKRMSAPGLANPALLRSSARIAGGMGDLIDVYTIGRSFQPGNRPEDAGKDVWMLSLSMNVPIWHGKYSAGVREAQARHSSVVSNRAEQLNRLSARVSQLHFEYRDAVRKIRLYRDTLVPKAEQSVATTEAAYRTGNAGFLDLIDTERLLLTYQLAYARALADHAQRLAQLERVVGRELPTNAGDVDEPANEPSGAPAPEEMELIP